MDPCKLHDLDEPRRSLARLSAARSNASDDLDRALHGVLGDVLDGRPVTSDEVMRAARRLGLRIAAERMGELRLARLELGAEQRAEEQSP